MRIGEDCLNLKNEWAGSEIPGISVSRPKGIASTKAEVIGVDGSQVLQAAIKRGCKRIEYVGEDTPGQSEEGMEGIEGKIQEGRSGKEDEEAEPPLSKRQRNAGLGDRWENVSPVNWKKSPSGKGHKAFASLVTGKEKVQELEWPDNTAEEPRGKVDSPRRKLKVTENTTPVKI